MEIKITQERTPEGRMDYYGGGKLIAADALAGSPRIHDYIVRRAAALFGPDTVIDWGNCSFYDR